MRRLLPTAKMTLHPAYGIEVKKGTCNLTRNWTTPSVQSFAKL
jgi:hypothetical protein